MLEEDFEGPAPDTKKETMQTKQQMEMKTIKEKSGDLESTEQGSSHLDEDVSMRSEIESKIGSQSCIFYEEEEFEVTKILGTNDIIFDDLEKNHKVRIVRKISSMSDYESDVNSDPTFELKFSEQLSKTQTGIKEEGPESPISMKIVKDEQEEDHQPKAAHVQQLPQGNADQHDLQVTGFMVFGDQEANMMY